MVIHRHAAFLSDAVEYRLAEQYWLRLWEGIDPYQRMFDRWQTPWLSTGSLTLLDGNPIFSAFSPIAMRGIRVIQYAPTTSELEVSSWLDTFGGLRTDPASIRELVIACALSDEAAARAALLMEQWVAGEAISLAYERAPDHSISLIDIEPSRPDKRFLIAA